MKGISRTAVLLILINFTLVIIAAFLYYSRIRPNRLIVEKEKFSQTTKPDQLIITRSSTNNSLKSLESIVLNKLIIEDYEFGTIKIQNENVSILNLKVSFTYNNKIRKLAMPVVGSIYLWELQEDSRVEQKLVDVNDLVLSKGDSVNIGLSFMPEMDRFNKEELLEMCAKKQSKGCLLYPRYINLGFGN